MASCSLPLEMGWWAVPNHVCHLCLSTVSSQHLIFPSRPHHMCTPHCFLLLLVTSHAAPLPCLSIAVQQQHPFTRPFTNQSLCTKCSQASVLWKSVVWDSILDPWTARKTIEEQPLNKHKIDEITCSHPVWVETSGIRGGLLGVYLRKLGSFLLEKGEDELS